MPDFPPAVASWRDQIERLSEIIPLATVADLRDALKIEAQAKRRLADVHDAAPERGEIQTRGGDRVSNFPERKDAPTVADLGLSYKAIHEDRQLRAAEAAAPGVIWPRLRLPRSPAGSPCYRLPSARELSYGRAD